MTLEIPRDRWKRPLVTPPTGGRPVAYTRATTFVGAIEDTFKLGQWQQRHVAVGLAMNPDLLDAVGAADLNDRDTLNRLCDEAKNRAGAGDSARLGTWLHSVTEAADRGQDPMSVPMPELAFPRDPSDFLPDVAAYVEATKDLKALLIEQFCVNDNLKVGGTPDRVVQYGGKRYIADLKTGSIEWGALKIAAQLAMYARSATYDPETGARGTHGAELDRGIVIHLPAGTGRCTLYWVDLMAGWDAVRVCRSIRDARKQKYRDLMEPVPMEPVTNGETLVSSSTLADRITAASDPDGIRDLWREHASEWTDDLTALAKSRIAQLAE